MSFALPDFDNSGDFGSMLTPIITPGANRSLALVLGGKIGLIMSKGLGFFSYSRKKSPD